MANRSKIHPAVERIETALTRAARSHPIPDYYGFQNFMAPRLERERDARAAKIHADALPFAAGAMMLLMRYHQRMLKGRPSPMDFRRYKLLRSLYSDGGRGGEVVDALLHGTLPPDPTLDADEVSPAVIRLRLIAAIQNGAFEDANFLLGRLDEADHDPGERAYLQALAAFASGKLERTIKLVENVPADAIDRPRAAWLAAKASALLGGSASEEQLFAEIADRLTPAAWLHLLELRNLTEELAAFMQRLPSRLTLEAADPAYDEWAQFHVQMMGRYIAREREILEASAATGEVPTDDALAADPVIQRCATAIFVEEQLGGSDQARQIAKWLHPVIAKGNVGAFRAALEMLADARDHTAIIALVRQFPSSAGLPWQRDLDIVGVVYAVAFAEGDRTARRWQRLLTPDLLEPAETAVQRRAMAAGLTPMGRISFLAAAAELDRVQSAADIWRDCGLIALGLFRALEVELNARLVRPLAARLDIASLISQLPPNERALRASLQKLSAISPSGNGLMLGDLRDVLTRMGGVDGDDPQVAAVRDQVRSAFEFMLSPAGRREPALDEITIMIGSAATRRFRNPPAHGQFLRLDDAAAALRHVEDGLDKLSRWLPNA